MKTTPLVKLRNMPAHARIRSLNHMPKFTQVEMATSERDMRDNRYGYENAPKAFKGADVRHIDGQWCWVLDDEVTPCP